MTIRKRVAALEGRDAGNGQPLTVRAWLGQPLSDVERARVEVEASRPVTVDLSKASKEVQAWLA